MTDKIDKRTVQMEFDNKLFEKNASVTMKSLDDLKRSLNFEGSVKGFDGINKAANSVDMSRLANTIDTIKDRFSLMGIVAFTIIQDITRRITGLMSQLSQTLITQPIKAGLSEYETQINAIQTILANTASKGTTLQEVNDVLDELNTYADLTIYNFTEMTRNIGTFTAAGVDLRTSADAIKGIANLAAVSGSNSQQAATAMYQLSQALSSGSVKLMDWNSVVNAGMGGQVFQDALKETARLHEIAIDQMIEEQGSFRETLSEGWLSSDVLLETLQKFTGDLTEESLRLKGYNEEQIKGILELGVLANDAATKVKTLTQLGETLNEAMQSGWTQTWEIILGDFEEAKAFFTGISDTLNNIIGKSAESRNVLLQGWKDLGGRADLVEAVYNALEGIQQIVSSIGEAFSEIFPPVTAENLKAISEAILNFSEKIKMGGESLDKIKRIFRGVFALFDIAKMFFLSLGEQIFGLGSGVDSILPSFVDFLITIADFIVKLRDSIKESKFFTTVLGGLFSVIKPVIGIIGVLFGAIFEGTSSLSKIKTGGLKEFFSFLGEKFKGLSKIGGIFGKLVSIIVSFFEKIKPILDKVGSQIREGFFKALDFIAKAIENIDVDHVLKVLNGGLLAGLLISFKGFFDKTKEIAGGGLFVAILTSIKKFIDEGGSVFTGVKDILESVKGSLEAYQKTLKANVLLKIAYAIGILALSLLALSFIDPKKLATALSALTVLFGELYVALDLFSKGTYDGKKLGLIVISLIAISSALLVLSTAIGILSLIKPERLVASVAAVGGLLAEMLLFMKFAANSKGLLAGATALVIMSFSLLTISGVIAIISKLPNDAIAKGLLTMAGSITAIGLATRALPGDLVLKAAGLLIVSGALFVLSKALLSFGSMSSEQVSTSLISLGGALLILVIALNAMTGAIGGAAALIIASGAIYILAKSLQLLGNLSIEQVGISLLAITGALVILGVAGSILTPVVPVLLGLGVAIGLIGIGALAAGVGLLAFATGLATLSVVGAAGISVLTLAIAGVVTLLPFIAKKIGEALLSLVTYLASKAPELINALLDIFRTLIKGFITITPEIVLSILELITSILEGLANELPKIIQAGYDILLAFLQGVSDNVGDVIFVVTEIITTYLSALGDALPKIIDAGYDLMINFIDGMTDSVEQNIPRLMSSVQNLGISIVKGVIRGIGQSRGELLAGIRDIGYAIIDEFRSAIGARSPSEKMDEAAVDLVAGFLGGLKSSASNIYNSVEEVGKNTISKFKNAIEGVASVLDDNVDYSPVITPVMNLEDIIAGSRQTNTLLNNLNPNISLRKSSVLASGINADNKESVDQQTQEDTTKTDGKITYVQNNYSPKELSPVEIYRLTRNQLLQANT